MSARTSRLKNFPISFFAIALGLIGFCLSMQKIEHVFEVQTGYVFFLWITIGIFILISIVYIIKALNHAHDVIEEFNHPVKMNFFPLIAKIFLVGSIIFLEINMSISLIFWLIGVGIQFISTVLILSIWFHHTKFHYEHLNPSWFIPVVGNVLIPIAGVAHGYSELAWFFFSIGIMMWITLFIIVFNRLIFHEPVAERLVPTFFILFAPPAVAFVSYVKLTEGIDPFARILYYVALFLFLFILCQWKMFSRLKFYLSWWAYSFPLAAMTVATIVMYHYTKLIFFKFLGGGMFLFLIGIILTLVVLTFKGIARKQLCVEEIH